MATLKVIGRRLLFLVAIIWAAATITFFIPRLSLFIPGMADRNPIRERLAELARTGGLSPGDQERIVAEFNRTFGLDEPILTQYFRYIGNVVRLDMGVSLYRYPRSVLDLIMDALPWSLSLLFVTTVLSFVLGNLFGAIAAWPRSPGWLRAFAAPFILLTGVPPVLLGVLLLFFLAFRTGLFPLGGAFTTGQVVDFGNWAFISDMLWHQILPAVSLILGSTGFWVLSMRGMGVTIQGEDYVTFAEHKGLSGVTIFRDYYLRNALLPQITGLALAVGGVVTSGVVVEGLFGLPGLGTLLSQVIRANDFPTIYGMVLFITIAVATLMVLAEFIYPLLDPRIRVEA